MSRIGRTLANSKKEKIEDSQEMQPCMRRLLIQTSPRDEEAKTFGRPNLAYGR